MPKGALTPLFNEVISKSESDAWEEAVLEWDIVSEREDEDRVESCVCGHEHLRYLFTIRNRYTGKEIYPIGSTCIRKFERNDLNEDLECRKQALRLMREAERLAKEQGKGKCVEIDSGFFSRKLIYYLFEQDAFRRGGRSFGDADRDYGFMYDMFNKRTLSDEQRERTREIIRDYVYPWLRNLYREVVLGYARQG